MRKVFGQPFDVISEVVPNEARGAQLPAQPLIWLGFMEAFELSGSRLSPNCGCSWTKWDTRFGFWIVWIASTSGTCPFLTARVSTNPLRFERRLCALFRTCNLSVPNCKKHPSYS